MSQLPEEIINYIFTYAFYPHEYPTKKYIDYNTCLADLPSIVKQCTKQCRYPFAHFKHTLTRLGKTIDVDQCEYTEIYTFLLKKLMILCYVNILDQ